MRVQVGSSAGFRRPVAKKKSRLLEVCRAPGNLDSQWENFKHFGPMHYVYLKKFELLLGLVVEEESLYGPGKNESRLWMALGDNREEGRPIGV